MPSKGVAGLEKGKAEKSDVEQANRVITIDLDHIPDPNKARCIKFLDEGYTPQCRKFSRTGIFFFLFLHTIGPRCSSIHPVNTNNNLCISS